MSQNLCCSICLDQFKVPVTIPCGHTFCQKCITVHWDKMTEASMDIKCPICNEKFDPRPTLKRNVTLSDVAETIQLGTESQGATAVPRLSAVTAQAQVLCERHKKALVYYCKTDSMCVCCECAIRECRNHEQVLMEEEKHRREEGLKKKSREVDKIKEDIEKKVQELSENINKTKVSLKQTSHWVNAKFASLVKVLAEKQESILSFIEQEQQLALSEAETNVSALEDRVQQLGEIQGQIATLQAMTDIQLIQESRLVEVPQMKDIPLDVPTNLQGRLSLITDVLSQISKLVSEDLEKAVNAAIGQDKQGDIRRSAAMSQNLCCSICLDQFKVPVTIPCGHTFCQKCITVHWDKMTEASMDIKCPICNEKFDPRPTLKRNVTLSDVAETIQLGTESQGATAVPRLSAVTAQAQVLCERHKKALVYYCKTDSMCVCCECAIRECRNHEQVLMEEEKQRREEGLKKKSREVDKIKEDTEKKVQELSENINKTKVSLKQTSHWVNAKFASLVKVLAEKQESILSFIEQEQQLALSEAETNVSALEDRVQQLGEIQGQIATLQAMTDIQLIQESRLVEVPQMKDIPLDVPTNLQSRLTLITDVLSQISKLVSEDLEKAVNAAIGQDKQGSPQDKRPVLAVVPSPATPCSPAVKEGLSAFHCTLTFDPRTANANLQLSQGNRRAEHLVSGPRQVPPHEARFDTTWQVLCFQSFTHGQHYWEVEVSKPWAYLGVTYQGIPRKEKGKRCMVGMNELSWSLQLDERQLSAWHNGRREAVAGHPQHHRIGMLLDYEAGTLTYYGDGQARLHAFHCAFSQELFPACWIGEGVSITLCTP